MFHKDHKIIASHHSARTGKPRMSFRGSAYCQTIRYEFLALVMSYCRQECCLVCEPFREGNKVKHFEWCQEYQQDNLDNVIWTDESSIQLQLEA